MLNKRKVRRSIYIPLPHTHALYMFMYNYMEIKKPLLNYSQFNFKNIK